MTDDDRNSFEWPQGRPLRFLVERRMSKRGFALNIARDVDANTVAVASELRFRHVGDVALTQDLLLLSSAEAQHLMDELYRAGVRPTEAESPGQVAAMQRHLDDLRRLVFADRARPEVTGPHVGGGGLISGGIEPCGT